MRIWLIILTLAFLLFGVRLVFASDPPVLSSPANASTTTSSKLQWQTPSYSLYPSSPYRIQVDDDSSFSSINKDYYTDNTYYTPSLSLGTWYWRVKAKDSSGTWSNWTTYWYFTLTNSSPSPSPSPSPPTPSSTTTTSLTTSAPSTNNSTSSFTISNTPSQINSDESFIVSVNLFLPDNQNTNFYLKGAFKKSDSSNYFGQTLVSDSWVKNSSSYSSQFPITTDTSGNWSGNLEIKSDADDTGFTGSGDYIFKVAKYTTVGSGPTWSNEANLSIIATAKDTQSPTNMTIPQPSISPPKNTSPLSVNSKSILLKNSNLSKINYQIATVAGVNSTASQSASTSGKIDVKNQKQFNPLLIIGTFLIFAGASVLGYIYLRKNHQ